MADHYYSKDPSSKSEVQTLSYEVGGRTYTFFSDHSVFSIQRVDPGSDLLIRTILKDQEHTEKILDLGCGYGPIGLVLADQLGAEATLMDINERAMDLARRGAAANRITAEVVTEDKVTDQDYTLVATNPPIRAGKSTVYHFFALAYEHLKENGALYVVIRKQQGADSAVKELKRVFGNCATIGRQSGYHILKSIKEQVS